jgi:hypothetical protein
MLGPAALHCAAVPGWVRLRSQAKPMGWLVQLPCLRYLFKNLFNYYFLKFFLPTL